MLRAALQLKSGRPRRKYCGFDPRAITTAPQASARGPAFDDHARLGKGEATSDASLENHQRMTHRPQRYRVAGRKSAPSRGATCGAMTRPARSCRSPDPVAALAPRRRLSGSSHARSPRARSASRSAPCQDRACGDRGHSPAVADLVELGHYEASSAHRRTRGAEAVRPSKMCEIQRAGSIIGEEPEELWLVARVIPATNWSCHCIEATFATGQTGSQGRAANRIPLFCRPWSPDAPPIRAPSAAIFDLGD